MSARVRWAFHGCSIYFRFASSFDEGSSLTLLKYLTWHDGPAREQVPAPVLFTIGKPVLVGLSLCCPSLAPLFLGMDRLAARRGLDPGSGGFTVRIWQRIA